MVFMDAINRVLIERTTAFGNLSRTFHLTRLPFSRQSESGDPQYVPRWIPPRVTYQQNQGMVLVENQSAVFVRLMQIMEELLWAVIC